MLVPMTVVGGVAVAVVDVVHMVVVGHLVVPAPRAVLVIMFVMGDMNGVVALVPMLLVGPMDVPVVEIVGVVPVVHSGMAARRAVGVVVFWIGGMGHGHGSLRGREPAGWPQLGSMDYGVMDDVGDVLVSQRVSRLPTAALASYKVDGAEHPKMLGDERLGDPQGVDQFVDATALAAEFVHDGEAVGIPQSPKQLRRRLQAGGEGRVVRCRSRRARQ